jgi:O-antigen/teichoic acid export membrane protein
MNRSIRDRLLKGIGANAFGQGVVVVIQLAGVPILLHYWGVQLYGEWLILFAIPAYLSMTDLGFSQSAANDMTARVARGERAEALAVFQSLGTLVFSAAGTGLILVSVLVIILPLDRWLHFEAISAVEVRWVLWLLAAEVFVKLTEGTSHAGFRANGEYALHTAIYYSTLLAQYASIWLLAAFGYGPVAAAAALLVIRIVVTPSVASLLVHRHAWLHFHFDCAHVAQLRALVRPALANIGFPLAQALNIQGMVLVVGATLGPVAVVIFSTLRTLTRLALQLVLSINHAAEPELATAYGSGDRALLCTLYQHALRAGLWLALGAALVLAAGGGWILEVWTHGKVAMQPALFYWLLATAMGSTLWYGGVTMLKAANRHLRASFIYAIAAGGAVVLAGALLTTTGNLANAGLALLLMDAVIAAYTLRAASRLCGSRALGVLRAALNPLPLLKVAVLKSHAR